MSATLRILSKILAFGDSPSSSNPTLRHIDWTRDLNGVLVEAPRAESPTIAAGQSLLVFDGTRALALDNSTTFDLELVTGESDRYRIRYTSGTDPEFRTDRVLDLSGCAIDVSVNANGTAVFTIADGPGSFDDVEVGDTFWLPTTEEAGSQPFHVVNQGFWTVIAVTSGALTVTREGDFEAYAEDGVAVTTNSEAQAFSSAGVQIGDKLVVAAGFVSTSQKTFSVVSVTPEYVEIQSSLALAEESDVVPGTAGLLCYTSGKRFLHVEADQECVIRVNGDTGDHQRLTPWLAGDTAVPAVYQKAGPTWSLTIVNKSTKPLHATILSCE